MKILQITTFFHPVTGGVETHVMSLSKELVAMGHEVEVLTSDSAKNGPRIKQYNDAMSGFKIKRFRTWFSLSYFHKFYPGIFFYLLKADFDVAHVHGYRKFEAYAALFAAKIRKKKVVLTTHNPFPSIRFSRYNQLQIKLHDWTFGKLFTRAFDKIIIILPQEKKIFVERFHVKPEKIVTIPNGLDSLFQNAGDRSLLLKEAGVEAGKYKMTVLCVTRLHEVKGIQNLIYAVKNLPDILFFIVGGDDGYLTKLKTVFLGLDNIIFNGLFIPPEKLINIYAGADIFVLPSFYEPFGIVLLEAMSQGCAIIATDHGGPPTFIKDNFGFTLDPYKPEAWYEKIRYLSEHPRILAKMKEEAKLESRKYFWPGLARKVEKVYKEVLIPVTK
jgi:glycosyltransferase involved in cell wall biosynthesis